MAPRSSTLAWKIAWTEEPGRLQSMGLLESDTTERLHFHFSLSWIGEGNGSPLQCSCLENPRDGGAWWAAVYGVAELDTTEVTQQQQQRGHVWIHVSYSYHKNFHIKPSVLSKIVLQSLSCVQFFTTPWTAAYQASLSMRFSRQEYWSGVPLPSQASSYVYEHSVRMFDPISKPSFSVLF